jgi:hypothetical protein
MGNRQRDLVILVAVAVLAVVAYRVVKMYRTAENTPPLTETTSTGLDEELRNTVVTLEADLASRLSFQPSFSQDPLNLRRVVPRIYEGATDTSRAIIEGPGLYLTATVLDETGYTAVIRYKHHNYVVQEGDEFEGHTVISIRLGTAEVRNPGGAVVKLTQIEAIPQLPPQSGPVEL